jgi:hypothetical protein
MAKRRASPQATHNRLKQLRSNTTRDSTIDSLAKWVSARQSTFFDHLHLDVRNLIYDYMKPTLRPFGDGKDWAGLYLSCRQARDELEDVGTIQFNLYIDKIKQEIASKPNAKLKITYTEGFKTIYLRGNIPAVSGIDKLSRLAELHVNRLSINFKLDGGSLSDEENIANKQAITQALSNVAYFFDCQQRVSPIYRAYFPPKLTLSDTIWRPQRRAVSMQTSIASNSITRTAPQKWLHDTQKNCTCRYTSLSIVTTVTMPSGS